MNLPIQPTKPLRMICSRCGSDNVSTQGVLVWDTEAQRWEVSDVLPAFDECADCGGPTQVVQKECDHDANERNEQSDQVLPRQIDIETAFKGVFIYIAENDNLYTDTLLEAPSGDPDERKQQQDDLRDVIAKTLDVLDVQPHVAEHQQDTLLLWCADMGFDFSDRVVRKTVARASR